MSGIDECLLEAMALPGARGAALVEWISGLALGRIGEAPDGDHETMAAQIAEFARHAIEHPVFAGAAEPGSGTHRGPGRPGDSPPPGAKGPAVQDVIVTAASGYHLLRFLDLPYEGGVFLHLWLDRDIANLALAMIRLRDLAERLVLE
ncbi:hypothetical protein [Actinacidiphila yeochonensis]|uniref:hypothetical protein n=1 Tax=Actinacidiphila yeochonensis TaxID=89050 RepID=UPI0005633B22|nr:hypothetical protein [Actinacidiphila yeochonensis]